MIIDVACEECARKGSGSKEDLLLDGWLPRGPEAMLCPACAVTLQTGVARPTAPPSGGQGPDRE